MLPPIGDFLSAEANLLCLMAASGDVVKGRLAAIGAGQFTQIKTVAVSWEMVTIGTRPSIWAVVATGAG